MTFFNQKEEVFDVQLTDEGKRQLSLGKFKPIYYAFYDDEVLYDPRYAGAGEPQNEAETRILDETAYPKLNARFKGAKQEGKNNYNKNNKKNNEALGYDIYLKESPFMSALGSYNSLTRQAPYFEISVLSENPHGLVTGSSTSPLLYAQVKGSNNELSITGGTTETYIPQINITSSYRFYFDKKMNTAYSYQDPLLFEIIERNTQFSNFKDNFEVEVFEVIEAGSKLSQAKLFILEDSSPQTPEEKINYQLKKQKIEKELQNLVGESLEVLLDEQAEPLFPPELLTKKAPNAKAKIICDDDK
tara:strand:- start:74 stop:979 length:906 start_codon:yes stop_codon:yes gene_type:complete